MGRKIQRAALESILRGRDPVRHYMRLRMPGFGDKLARELSKLFAAADADPNERPSLVREKDPNFIGTSEWGRELIGKLLLGVGALGGGGGVHESGCKAVRASWRK